jgi:hypothetical protein
MPADKVSKGGREKGRKILLKQKKKKETKHENFDPKS